MDSINVTTNSSSFERARSVARERSSSAERSADEAMKNAVEKYEKLIEKLMAENATLSGRITALEARVIEQENKHHTILQASKEETSTLQMTIKKVLEEKEAMKKTIDTLNSSVKTLEKRPPVIQTIYSYYDNSPPNGVGNGNRS